MCESIYRTDIAMVKKERQVKDLKFKIAYQYEVNTDVHHDTAARVNYIIIGWTNLNINVGLKRLREQNI